MLPNHQRIQTRMMQMLHVSLALSKIAVDRSNGNALAMRHLEIRLDRTVHMKDEPNITLEITENDGSFLATSIDSNENHDIIDADFFDLTDIEQSEETEQVDGDQTKTIFKCKFCKFVTKYRFSLRRHEVVHKNKKEVKSPKAIGDKRQIELHSEKHDKELNYKNAHDQSSKRRKYKCKYCDYACNSKLDLNRHAKMHSNVVCDHCNKIFLNPWNLKQHKRCVARKTIG